MTSLDLDLHLQRLGISELTDAQKQALEIINMKKDIFIALPTGSGKSLIYQLAPHLPSFQGVRKNKIVVVMPLVSLMEQQLRKLELAGYTAITVTDLDSGREALTGDCQYIFCSPEKLSEVLMSVMIDNPQSTTAISHVVVDETHCVAKWGQRDKRSKVFREKFAHIGKFRSVCPGAVFLAMTATATKDTESAVCKLLQMTEYSSIRESPEKSNIRYSVVIRKDADVADLFFTWLVQEFKSSTEVEKTLIFFKDLGSLGEIFAFLRRRCPSDSVAMFHSELASETKTSIMNSFCRQDSPLRVVLCSSAFSMGMDIRDIRRVFHYGVPVELEDYIQETGRAGRDGKDAVAIILRHDNTLAGGAISKPMKDYLSTKECRRKLLLSVFGEEPVYSGGFGCCDNCAQDFCSCCSCEEDFQCDHTSQGCYCVKQCIQLQLDYSSSTESQQIRPARDEASIAMLESDLYALIITNKTTPSNINTIYQTLIDNIISNYQTIDSIEDVMLLGAFNVDDAQRILDLLNCVR